MFINKITVNNFKAVSSETLHLKGCSAIISAGNDKGKTSILRGLIDRILGEKPSLILKRETSKGFNSLDFTDGSNITWSFTSKTEKFVYTSPEGLKQTSGVISAIKEKYFGQKFNIDRFLSQSSREQTNNILKIFNIDLTSLEKKYHDLCSQRKSLKSEIKTLQSISDSLLIKEVTLPSPSSIELKSKIHELKTQSKKLLEDYNLKVQQESNRVSKIHQQNSELEKKIESATIVFKQVSDLLENSPLKPAFSFTKAKEIIESLPKSIPIKPNIFQKPCPPDIQPLEDQLHQTIIAEQNYNSYLDNSARYNQHISKIGTLESELAKLNSSISDQLQLINLKLKDIKNLPQEFSFDPINLKLLFNNLPLESNQISKSGKYIAALKLASLCLGELRTLHFDASPLDFNNMQKIQKWAQENNLQLLIEIPDYDGGEIQYEIIQNF